MWIGLVSGFQWRDRKSCKTEGEKMNKGNKLMKEEIIEGKVK